MLRTISDLKKYTIHATDGDMGHVVDCYFDDQLWAVRYLIVETGMWLFNRKVLISPIAIGKPDWDNKALAVQLTKEQVKNSPAIDTDKPVSRQHENDYIGYYGYPGYWGGAGLWGVGMYPDLMMQGYVNNTLPIEISERKKEQKIALEIAETHASDDIHLRSCNEVIGYGLHATDGDVGHVSGMLVDEKSWAIRYLIVETGHWWSGHTVLIAPLWIDQIQWSERNVTVSLTQNEVKNAPLYDSSMPLNRELEIKMHQHYRRAGYWQREGTTEFSE